MAAQNETRPLTRLLAAQPATVPTHPSAGSCADSSGLLAPVTSPNTLTGWNVFKRPIAALLVLAQVALGLAPLSAAAQSRDPAAALAANPVAQSQVRRMAQLDQRMQAGRAAQARHRLEAASPAERASRELTRIQELTQRLEGHSAASTTTPGTAPESIRAIGPNVSIRIQGQSDAGLSASERASLLAELRRLLSNQGSAQAAQRTEFAATRRLLDAKHLPSSILERHDSTVAQFEERANAFNRLSQTLLSGTANDNSATQAAIAQLNQYFQSNPSVRPQTSNTPRPQLLPWSSPKATPRAPAENKTEWFVSLNRSERVHLAQAGGIDIGGLHFNSAPAPTQSPQPADLTATDEAPLSSDIRAKAQELGYNPVAIVNWVQGNIQWQPTWGSIQGAQGVLQSGRGNAIDTASLLVALLRASHIPARYQFGTIDVPAQAAMNWVGGAATPEAALSLLAQGGIAARGLAEGGQIKTIRMEHVWVSAYVNWAPGRGSRDGGAQSQPPLLDGSGKVQHPSSNPAHNAWVPLDGSYKQYSTSSGLRLGDIASFDSAAVLASLRQGATCTAASARSLDSAALSNHYSQYLGQVRPQLQAQVSSITQAGSASGAATSVASVLGSQRIINPRLPLLAAELPLPVVSAGPQLTALPESLRWQVGVQLMSADSSASVLNWQRPLAEPTRPGAAPLVLSFVPQTSDDALTLAALLESGSGADPATGLPAGAIAAYLVKVRARLSQGGVVLAEGGDYTLGQSLPLRTRLINALGQEQSGQEWVRAGETHVWAIQGAGTSSAQLSAVASSLGTTNASSASNASTTLLAATAQAWQAQVQAQSGIYQSVASAIEVRQPGLVRAGAMLQGIALYGLTTQVRSAGVALQADILSTSVAARASASANVNASFNADDYTRQTQQRASAQAHHLLDSLYGEGNPGAQSAVSALAWANAQGQSLWRADSDTLAQVLTGIDADSSVRQGVQQAVAQGQQALLASRAISAGATALDPLIVLDAASHSASYNVVVRDGSSGSSSGGSGSTFTALRPGVVGWLGLVDTSRRATVQSAVLKPALQAAQGQLNSAAAILQASDHPDSTLWSAYAGQDELLSSLYLYRLSQSADSRSACDWAASVLAAQLGQGLAGASGINHAPVITSSPVTSAASGSPYGYTVQAVDPDGQALSYRLLQAPSGMGISASGQITWANPATGQHSVSIQVSDGQATAQQDYTLVVTAAASGLNLSIALSPSIADAGQSVTLSIAASTSSGGSAQVRATLDGRALTLSSQGGTSLVTFAAPAAGAHPVVVTASDGSSTGSGSTSASVTRETILTVRDASDTSLPQALITSPQSNAELRGVVTLAGTASDEHFAYYRVLMRRVGESDSAWQEMARGLQPVINGTLAQLDTSRLSNGPWEVALVVVDVNGATSSASITVDVVGNLKLGPLRLSFTDVRADATGLPLLLTRSYDSTQADTLGDFGWGWRASGQDVTVRKNMPLGKAWPTHMEGFQLCLEPEAGSKRRVTITLPDGGLYRFEASNSPRCATASVPQVNLQFTPLPGPTGGSMAGNVNALGQLRVINNTLVMAAGGMLVDADTGEPWNPTDFELTTAEGAKYYVREGVGVLSVTDPYGNQVSYSQDGYRHSANLSVSLERDSLGRITRATDPAGLSLAYSYNSQGELQSVTDRLGQTTRFAYTSASVTNGAATSGNQGSAHLLASITAPNGQVILSNQFDELGRLTASSDALGQSSQQSFDLAASRQTMTDRRGNKTVYTFDADGNITAVTNALGQTTRTAFDANGNETSTTDALGQTTQREFDLQTGKQLSETNPLGHTTRTSYPASGQPWERTNPLSVTDARGNVTTYTYAFGQDKQVGAVPRIITEPLGRSTGIGLDNVGNLIGLTIGGATGSEAQSWGYDAQGRRTVETNGLGQATTYTYDSAGNETSRTVTKTEGGVTKTYTSTQRYDSENRLIEATDALGGKTTYAYNSAGKVTSQTDAQGRVTRTSYDANARLIRTDYPDGTSETTAYDANGNEVSKTDRAGRSTQMDYDALNRLVKTTYPDGTSDSSEYDAAGRVIASTDRLGVRTTVDYDAAGRQTATTNALGQRTSTTYDENGNRTSQTGTDGRVTSYEYDALNRLTLTTWPDGSTQRISYRTDNRKDSETDSRGTVTRYGWDAAGRLVSVSLSGTDNSNSATTTYGYDETAAKTTQTDALGRSTHWTTDGLGRITARQIQDGSQESSRYDSSGARIAKTTFAGEMQSWQYDSAGRAVAHSIPTARTGAPGASIRWNYSAAGELLSHSEQGTASLNGTQSYRYDANQALSSLSNPLGQLGYERDAAGQITQRSVSSAGSASGTNVTSTSRYVYNAAGQLVQVTASDGMVTRYGYDVAGRLVKTERQLQSGSTLVSHQGWDSADRLISIAHVLQSTASAGTSTGAITSSSLIAGQSLMRAAGGAISRIDTYRAGSGDSSFDVATGSFAGTPAKTQQLEYDGQARLTRELVSTSAGSSDTRYDYDAVGNRSQKVVSDAAGSSTTRYSYDSADRLTQESISTTSGGSRVVNYGWDQNGNLSSKSEVGKTTLYRFDALNRLIDIRTGSTQTEASAAQPSVSYGYDAEGNRIKKSTASGLSSSYLIDPQESYAQVALESRTSSSNGVTAQSSVSYLRGLGLIRQSTSTDASANAPEVIYPLAGHLGTSLGAVDANGQVVEQTGSDAFGNLTQGSGLKQSHLYTGEYWDEDSQLVYLRARWYDPVVGRFVSGDPFEGRQQDPRSLNRYAYAHNDPVHGADPSGREFNLSGQMTAVSAANFPTASGGATIGAWVMSSRLLDLIRAGVRLHSYVKALEAMCLGNQSDPRCKGRDPTFFVGGDYLLHTKFVESAQLSGSPALLTKGPERAKERWYADLSECNNGKTGRAIKMDCDEYPYAAANEGGKDGYYMGVVRLMPMPHFPNRGAGSMFGKALKNPDCPRVEGYGEKSRILIVPLPSLSKTFYTCGM